MNFMIKKIYVYLPTILYFITFFLIGSDAFASEESNGWRETYDKGMMIFNFLILVFLFIRYAKNPLKEFLLNRKLEIAREIQRVEDEKQKWLEKLQSAQKDLDESQERFEQVKQSIILQGKNRRQELIDEARRHGELMINKTKQKLDNDILRAKDMLRTELVDAAIDLAIKNLPSKITEKDKDKFIDKYLSSLTKV